MKVKAYDRLKLAISEATRFLVKARTALTRLEEGKEDIWYSQSYAAAKRSSMDLSRSLTQLRKSLYKD